MENKLILEIFEYVKREYGTIPDNPWKNSPGNYVLRHKDTNKWYGLIMSVERKKLGLSGTGIVDVINLKCEPLLADILRQQSGILPAYHMNHVKWISVLLDGSVSMDTILGQIDMSYSLTDSNKK
ncbi:MAG TPA: MmcQ protein [Lachnospiraceae bacterium]|nr:MmcQ protein [Lachnospiraceae bacterium]